MEPINYKRAIVRRWPLIVVIAIVCAVVGVLIPIHAPVPAPKSQWQATALAGVPPPKVLTAASAAATLVTVKYYAEQEGVYTATAKAMHLPKSTAFSLRKDIQFKTKASLPSGSTYIYAKQPTKKGAAKLANAFVKALGSYVNSQLSSQYKTQLSQAQSAVNTLSNQLAAVETQIATLTKPAKSKTPTPTTTTTTSTTVPKATTTTVAPTTTTTVARTTTTTVAPTTTTTTPVKAGPDGTTTTIGEPSTVPVTTSVDQSLGAARQSPVIQLDVAVLDKPHTTTTTTHKAPKSPTTTVPPSQLALLQEREKTLQTLLGGALQRLSHLQTEQIPQSGFTLLQPARPGNAKFIPASLDPLDHRSIRALAGFGGGLVLGVIIALLMDGFDRRLRTAPRTRVVFGLPVIAEIPKQVEPRQAAAARQQRSRKPPARRRGKAQDTEAVSSQPLTKASSIAVVDAPASVVAEAYRRLRVSVMFAPLARNGRDQNPDDNELADGYKRMGSPANDRNGTWREGNGDGLARPGQAGSNAERGVIMVTSAGSEPSTSEVVLNLAAAYAEAGERVLVVSTSELRSKGQFAPMPDPSWTPPPTEPVHTGAVQVPAGGVPDAPTQQFPAATAVAARVGDVGSGTGGRHSVTPEEVVARCVAQRISGVSKLELAALLRGPGELATRGDAVITTARQVADVVIVEAPAVLGATDAEALVRSVDSVLVVAQCYFTTVSQAKRAGELLRGVSSPTLGVVLTDVFMTRKERRAMLAGLPGRP